MERMKKFSLEDLGTLVHIFVKGDFADTAQLYLNEMQDRVTAAKANRPATVTILSQLPLDQTQEPVKGPPPLIETAEGPKTVPTKTLPEIVQAMKEGLILSDTGEILAISTQPGDRGYDPEAHEKHIRIFCDNQHIPFAHTADVEAGTVKYYKKDSRGRIKTQELRGKVEIKAHIPEEED